MSNLFYWLIALGAIVLVSVLLRTKWTSKENYDDKFQRIRTRYNILNITVEKGDIPNDNIVRGNTEFVLLDSDCGYSLDTPIKMIEKNSSQCYEKSVLIRHKVGGMDTGTAFDFWGIYTSTGRIAKKRRVI